MITVVNIKHATPEQRATGVYIGRANGRYRLKASMFANPYKIGRGGMTREESISRYRRLMRDILTVDGPLRRELDRLTDFARHGDLILLCWCAPLACHGDVIKELIEERLTPRHHGFYTTTPNGHVAHVKGDPNMSEETLAMLGKMFDLAYEQYSKES